MTVGGGALKPWSLLMPQRKRPDPIAGQLNMAMQQLLSQTFGRFAPDQAWSPNVNSYQLQGRLVVCADLAGVDRDHVEVRVEPGKLEIRGERPVPEPTREPDQALRILSMEIDDGTFCRTLRIPESVLLDQVESTYERGMLWVVLPLKD
jgi:HSP20 family protein